MKIPFGTITITENSKKMVGDILDSGRVSSGRYVREFEQRFAALLGVKEAVAVSSGTDADILAMAVLHDLGAERGDEIILPALSFPATGHAVLHAGFTPVFVDVERDTLNIDPSKIEDKISDKTKAILVVHLMGKPAKMDEIMAIAKKHNLFVIEDAAEAHGAVYSGKADISSGARHKGKNVGTIGDLGAFSTYLAHIISTIEGGVVTTNRSDFAEILRSLRSHGRACKCNVCTLNVSSGYCPKRFTNGEDIRFNFERIGYSSKMNEVEAAVGLGNLDVYQSIVEKRRKNLSSMIKKFEKFAPYFTTLREEDGQQIGPHAFPIIIKEGQSFSRNQLVDYLEKNEIETRHLFSSMPTQHQGFAFMGYKLGEFPEAEYIGRNGLHIGCHQDLGQEHIDYFIERIEKFLTEYVK